jgi:hypothetical protein
MFLIIRTTGDGGPGSLLLIRSSRLSRAQPEVITALSTMLRCGQKGSMTQPVMLANKQAVALAQALGLVPVFETARMYTGPVRAIKLERVFGITSFELG